MKDEKYFYFSECQRRAGIEFNKYICFCELKEDGQIVEYTECSSKPMPAGKWVDYEHLGVGVWHHVEANPHWNESSNIFDLLKGLL